MARWLLPCSTDEGFVGRPNEGPATISPPAERDIAEWAACMPLLAGKPLQPPRFQSTNWRVGQTFSEKDDPDRTKERWAPPKFVQADDPAARHAGLTVKALPVPWHRMLPGTFIRAVKGALSAEQCAALLERVNEKGFTPALINLGHAQQLAPHIRDGHRVIVDNKELADWLLELLRPHLPARLETGGHLKDLNERLRFLCYTPRQKFDVHRDGKYLRPDSHPNAGHWSHITVQIYLHDVPQAHGGATTFEPETRDQVAFQPEVGSVLLFTQDLPHEGSILHRGIKYTLRTEAMYG